jgi:glutamine amidotransferase
MMDTMEALLIDAGTGNLHSVENALRSLGYRLLITSDPHDVLHPGRVILPGVGAFGTFMHGLHRDGLDEALREVVRRGDPLFGICVGMQALFEGSGEMGSHLGLGLLPGRVVRFPEFADLKVPHTGWNQLDFRHPSALFDGLQVGCYTYFNHAYYCAAADDEDVLATTDYGLAYPSAVQRGNLFGVQFHPEKSQKVGLQILANFFLV